MEQRIRFSTVVLTMTIGLLLSACATQPHKELSDVVGLQQQAQTAYDQGDWAQAQSRYLELTRVLPDDESNWFHLGNVYAWTGQYEFATDCYRHVLAHEANHAKAWHNLGVVLMQQSQAAFVQSARVAQAEPEVQHASLTMGQALEALIHPNSPAEKQDAHVPVPPEVHGDKTAMDAPRSAQQTVPVRAP